MFQAGVALFSRGEIFARIVRVEKQGLFRHNLLTRGLDSYGSLGPYELQISRK